MRLHYPSLLYLHSTLVILQSLKAQAEDRAHRISTFHSGYITIGAMAEFNATYQIYIPLWLYYNAKSDSILKFIDASTFHSGYITMNQLITDKYALYKSTFHSGYITILF